MDVQTDPKKDLQNYEDVEAAITEKVAVLPHVTKIMLFGIVEGLRLAPNNPAPPATAQAARA